MNNCINELNKEEFGTSNIVLEDNGNLYINNELYARNVKKVLELNEKNVFFIYNNNLVERYIGPQIGEHDRMKQYDKVLYGYNYLITLKENKVEMYFFIIIANGCANLKNDDTYSILFEDVDDVEIEKVEMEPNEYIEEVVLYKNNEKIRMPILGIFKET